MTINPPPDSLPLKSFDNRLFLVQDWQVRSLKPGAQKEYEILSANFTLMAIPLAAGEHLLRVAYRPLPFVIGAWVSAIAWLTFGGLLGFVFLRRRKIGDLQG